MEQKKQEHGHKNHKTFPASVEPENSLAARMPELAAQWDVEKNAPLTPEQVTYGSRKKVWWRCERGHSWLAMVKRRSQRTGCPVCANRMIIVGLNDWPSRFPAVAAQWDAEKNAPLRPCDVTPGSNKSVFWRCRLGHSYQSRIGDRTVSGHGCPYCTGRKVLPGFNDLATLYPVVAAQWHPSLNGELKPTDVTRGSRRKVWWQCAWGHEWQACIFSRTQTPATGCPYCAKPHKIAKDLAFDYDRITKNRDRIEERAKAAQQTRKGALYL